MMMSSIEPLIDHLDLTESEEYGDNLKTLIGDLKEEITEAQGIPSTLQHSLRSQVGNLKMESIGQGLKRLSSEFLPEDDSAFELLKECYEIRSTIVHEGGTDDYLQERTKQLRNVLRRLFSSIIGLPLESSS